MDPSIPATVEALGTSCSTKTFMDIADNTHDPKEVDKVLSLTDNMSLAISLIAHLADSEGCSHVLSRWQEEKTSLISDGYNRTSNLDLSISLSLSSPRLNPHSKDLLSLLSMLPDGLSDVELVQSKLPIDNILNCKAALVGTTLAYGDEHKRLKVLVPIREYIQKIQPPGDHLIRPLLKHFQELLEFFMEYEGNESSSSTVARVSSNYSNIQNVLGWIATGTFRPNTLISDGLEHFKKFHDPDLKCRFYIALAAYYRGNGDPSSATKFGLRNCAWVEWDLGNYAAAQLHANAARQLALISADLYREAQALDIEATCCHTLGNYTKSMSLCFRARHLLGLCGMSHGPVDHNIMTTQAENHKPPSEGGKFIDAQTICESCWGDLDGMPSWTVIFLVNSLKRKEKLGIFKAFQSLGDIFLSQNDEHTATSLIAVALEGFTEMDVHRSRAECMLRLGDISMGHSDLLKAVEFWDAARPLFEHSLQTKQVQHLNERLAGISEDVLEQQRHNLAHLALLNAPAGTVEELEEDLSDIEDLDKADIGDEKELGLIAV
ncbi:hypothetical protein B0H13DRAFT_1882320 [Mycena leptocephala]|nr:hypothetical protein B0H13DRAFT_1882320 [Mycena leptocephala]